MQDRLTNIEKNPNVFVEKEHSFLWSVGRGTPQEEYEVLPDQPEQGSNSVVKKCLNRTTNQTIILKALKVYDSNPTASWERFVKEVDYQQLVASKGFAPQILHYGLGNRILDLPAWEFLGKDMLYIMMEYKGQTLTKYLPGLYDDQADQLQERIKSVYAALAQQGLIMNDLTAENIVVDRAGNVTVIDFDPENLTYLPPSDRPDKEDLIENNDELTPEATLVDIMAVAYPEQFESIENIFSQHYFPHRCGDCKRVYDGQAQCPCSENDPAPEPNETKESSATDSSGTTACRPKKRMKGTPTCYHQYTSAVSYHRFV